MVAGSNSLMRIKDVCAYCGISKTTIHVYRKNGAFPSPLQIGARIVAWRRSEIEEFVAATGRKATSDGIRKECTKCHCIKQLSDFGSRNGVVASYSQCKQCVSARSSEWYKNNKHKIAEKIRTMRPKINAVRSIWRQANPEKDRVSSKAWRKNNSDKYLALAKENRDSLTDNYVRTSLKLRSADCNSELIAAKREQLQIHRLTKELMETISEVTKGEEK